MLIDGNKIAEEIRTNIRLFLQRPKNRAPGLAFICVGSNPASRSYVNMKKKKCKEVGIHSEDIELPDSITENELLKKIEGLNHKPEIDGILVQLPLPPHIDTQKVMESIDPSKDVDGFHPINIGKLLLGRTDGFIPCTPKGISYLLYASQISIEGKHVVILGRSNIVGKPLAALLMQKHENCNATVTIAHSLTQNLTEICKSADILVAAIGQPLFVKREMIKPGAAVIDVGINRISGASHLVGDVDFDHVAPICSHITPVPGGVGPMTIAMLLENTLKSYQLREKIS